MAEDGLRQAQSVLSQSADQPSLAAVTVLPANGQDFLAASSPYDWVG
jgi:hypothetical protein